MAETAMPGAARVPRWLRGFLVFLAVPQLVTGLWAVLGPRDFFAEFPGFGPLLVAAEPPFNAHLVSDAGAGFLATGVVLAVAAVTGSVGQVRLALVAYLAFAVPHLVYHATHPAPGLTAAEDAGNVALLTTAVLLPAVLLLLTRPSGAGAPRAGGEAAAAPGVE